MEYIGSLSHMGAVNMNGWKTEGQLPGLCSPWQPAPRFSSNVWASPETATDVDDKASTGYLFHAVFNRPKESTLKDQPRDQLTSTSRATSSFSGHGTSYHSLSSVHFGHKLKLVVNLG